jgi:hypothetical protein
VQEAAATVLVLVTDAITMLVQAAGILTVK